MSDFLKYHRPGQGMGHKPPMETRAFVMHCIEMAAIIVLIVADLRLFNII
jgi:hypothetical protein